MKRPGLTLALPPAMLFLLTSLRAGEPAVSTPPSLATASAAAAQIEAAPETAPPPRPTSVADVMKQFDRNGDGKLDEDERAAAHETMLQQQGRREAAKGAQEFRARMLERFDQNHDGKLDDEERAAARKYAQERGAGDGAFRAELLKRFDKNGDGRLDETERTEMQQAMPKRMAEFAGAMRDEILRRFDENKDGRLSDQEWAVAAPQLRERITHAPLQLRRYDKNGDGKLDDEEWTAAAAQIRRWLEAPVAQPQAAVRPKA